MKFGEAMNGGLNMGNHYRIMMVVIPNFHGVISQAIVLLCNRSRGVNEIDKTPILAVNIEIRLSIDLATAAPG